jgi:hypothetical protein
VFWFVVVVSALVIGFLLGYWTATHPAAASAPAPAVAPDKPSS